MIKNQDEQFKAPLSKSIQKEYVKLINIVKEIENKDRVVKLIDGTAGKISVADLIAYQIGWGSLLINWYETRLKQQVPVMPGGGFNKWDYIGLAEHFYKQYQYDSSIKQIEEFHKIVMKIINIVEYEHETENLDKVGIWAWCTLSSGKQWPLSKWVTVNTVSPYKRALTLLRKFVKNN